MYSPRHVLYALDLFQVRTILRVVIVLQHLVYTMPALSEKNILRSTYLLRLYVPVPTTGRVLV